MRNYYLRFANFILEDHYNNLQTVKFIFQPSKINLASSKSNFNADNLNFRIGNCFLEVDQFNCQFDN